MSTGYVKTWHKRWAAIYKQRPKDNTSCSKHANIQHWGWPGPWFPGAGKRFFLPRCPKTLKCISKEDARDFMLGQGSPAAGLTLLLEKHCTHIPSADKRTADSTIRNSGELHLGSLIIEEFHRVTWSLEMLLSIYLLLAVIFCFTVECRWKCVLLSIHTPAVLHLIKPFAVQERVFGTPLLATSHAKAFEAIDSIYHCCCL